MAQTKLGRPFVYQSEDEKPRTVSVRIPRELFDQLEARVRERRTTLTEALLEGARLWIDTPADPRELLSSNDNTVIRELEEMIRAAVEKEIGKLNTFMESARDVLKPAPTPAQPVEPEPEPDISYDGNTVLHVGREMEQEAAPTPPPYDTSKYYLGKLCKHGHNYHGTGQSLLYRRNRRCVECDKWEARRRRLAKRQP
jgi:hypothetical protein